MGKVRVIAGEFRSRTLTFPDNIDGLRPTSDRVKETVFNWIGNDIFNKFCLDLFSGSGSLSFEACSRGAKEVFSIEKNKLVYQNLLSQAKLFNIKNMQILNTDALTYLENVDISFNYIFIDPPFSSVLHNQVLNIILKRHDRFKNTIIYIEQNTMLNFNGFEIIKSKKAGNVYFGLIKLI